MTLEQHAVTITVCVALFIGQGCKPPDDIIFVSDATGMGDTGIVVPDVDLPAEGEPDVPLPTGECIQSPLDGAFGYWHQCFGHIQVNFEVEYEGEVYPGGDMFSFGPGQQNPDYWTEPDSYELPLVAACCGPFDYPNPTTAEKIPYVNSCLFDAVQQICVGLPHFIRKQAGETKIGEGKLALEALAGKIEEQTADCVWGLWEGGPPGPNGQQVNTLLGTTWSPSDTSATIEIAESEVNDWTVPGDVPELTECHGIYDNDAAVIPTAPFSAPGTLGGGTSYPLAQDSSASGAGPWSAAGQFTLSSGGSTVTSSVDASGGPMLSGLHLEAAPTVVSIGGERVQVKHTRLVLSAPLSPSAAGGELMIDAGAAAFTVGIGFDDDSRIVRMQNIDPLVFRFTGGGWNFDPFDLVYDEQGVGLWTLGVDGLEFGTSAPN